MNNVSKFIELTKAFSNTANEDTVEKFNELTDDSLSKLSVVDLAIYNEEKATFDSLAELRAVEKSI